MKNSSLKRAIVSLLIIFSVLWGYYMTSKIEDKTKYLKDYKPSEFNVDGIHLTIDLHEDSALVTNVMSIVRAKNASKAASLTLDGNSQELIKLIVDGKLLENNQYEVTDHKLTISTNEKDKFSVTIVSKIFPQKNTSLAGLYQAEDIFLTQCEPNGFSKITYFLDRPDVMTVYTTTLIADKKYPVLLSNGDKIDHGDLPGNRWFVTWKDHSKKPSYLFAAVIGDLKAREDVFITKSGKKVDLRIYAPDSDFNKTAYAMESLKNSMKWDEDVFGREYDLNTYMIVSTPKFNMGAMENKGLNIFNNKFIIADKDTASDQNHIDVHDVIGHEYFHNWTGNRITLRNWFQLSLKEGLTVFREQEFSSDKFGRGTKRIDDANTIRSVQFKEDAGALSHPVRPESYIAMDNFYTSTVYEKGSEVIRMLKTIIGDEAFAQGMQLYFKRHDGEAVTTEDFVRVMEDASGLDLTQFKLWYSQAGTPNIDVTDSYNEKDKTYTLSFKQYCPLAQHASNKPFYIPIKLGLISEKTGKDLTSSFRKKNADEHIVHLTEDEQSFVFTDVAEKPVPSLLRDFSAPVKLNYPYSDNQLLFLLAHDSNEFNKWDAGQKYFTNLILELIKNPDQKTSPNLLASIKLLLNNEKLDKTFVSYAISTPSETNLYSLIEDIDPNIVFKAKKHLEETIGKELNSDFLAIYQKLNDYLKNKEYSLSKEDISARALKNLSLQYLNNKLGEELAQKQLENADNITDRLAALRVLTNSDNDVLYKKTITDFYNEWKHDDLIIDKWFAMQALSTRSDVINTVKELLKHPAFDIKTPNRVYALLGSFSRNYDKFHAIDGGGYELFADFIIEIDKINPSVAARLTKTFENYKRFEPKRKAMMHAVLQKIKNQHGLSDDTNELVSKILQ
jgi:aminopeptidase N